MDLREADLVRTNRLLDALIEVAVAEKSKETYEAKLNVLDALFTICKKKLSEEEVKKHEDTFQDLLKELNSYKAGQKDTKFYSKSRLWENELRTVVYDKKRTQ